MLLELVRLQEIVQYEKNSQMAILHETSMHGWFIYGFQFVTLSGDQNEVFEYLVLQSLLLRPVHTPRDIGYFGTLYIFVTSWYKPYGIKSMNRYGIY